MRTEQVVTKDRDERATYNIIKRLVDDREEIPKVKVTPTLFGGNN